MQAEIGFLGLGVMGTPMALNLVRQRVPLVLWSRSKHHYDTLREAGGCPVDNIEDVLSRCRIVIVMLATEDAIDTVLGRWTTQFADRVGGHMIVNMGTTSIDYSRKLSADIQEAGGRYVEAPVSGSRKPAELGQLVAMLAGEPADVEEIRHLIGPLCRERITCGIVPSAMTMKLAVNLFLITMVTGLAEATHFAQSHGIDLEKYVQALNSGPMASDVSRVKIAKLASQDFTVQAAISDVLKNSRLVFESARSIGIASPLMDVCRALYGETEDLGFSQSDMVAVIRAIEQRTAQFPQGR